MPDGRVLVVSQHELAFSDGVRWEAYGAADDQSPITASVAVDHDGRIYTGMAGALARIDLGEDGRWHLNPVMKLPPNAASQNATLVSVATFADHWYWYGGNGAVVSWQPGQPALDYGNLGSIDQIFTLDKDVYASDQSSGALYRLKADRTLEQVKVAELLSSESVSCAIPFGPGLMLVGTNSAGLKIFDGKSLRPFGLSGMLNTEHRITDLCATSDGFFAASIDTIGIILFDREGRTIQVLERSLDHRLARVHRLKYARNGVLWALLNDGVARVEFPSPISHFEALLPSGLTYAQPIRHASQLWIIADGRAMRGIYDANGRLARFEDETPPGRFLHTLTEIGGQFFSTNDRGIYVYEPTGWRMILSGITNARIAGAQSAKNGIIYLARGEYGVIQQNGANYTARRIAVPDLLDSYNSEVDSAGIIWFELGMGRIGRLDPRDGDPVFQILGTRDGLAEGWVELYLIDGIARFHLAGHLYRFDDAQRKFVEDVELLARFPQLIVAGGRPVTDSFGRLWYTANGSTHVIDRSATGGNRPFKITPVGFAPTSYTAEADGVIWMFERRRLARMDLRLPPPPVSPLRALITSVEFSASNRRLFAPGATLEALNYADNSLVIRFAAPANPFALPITFEVLLEGAGTQWASTGAVGSASFNRLKEGNYVFRVRPVAAGTSPGAEARLEFTVRPPWYRTPLAWTIYGLATVGLLAFVTWLSSYLQRRENERLELLVTDRTRELNLSNAQLGRQIAETTEKSAALSTSEERYRALNTELEDRVQRRTAELSLSHAELQQREMLFRLIFEQAPVGIAWKRSDLGGISHINSAFRSILALSGDTLADDTQLFRLVHPEDAPRHFEMNQRIASGATDSYNLEERFVISGGQVVWGSVSVAVVRDQSGSIIQEIGILEDITARKQAESDLASTYKNLVEASRMAGMAEVATGVLHNVGNVLNSLNVSSTVIASGVRHSKVDTLTKLSLLLHEHSADLGEFLMQDPKGKRVPEFIASLASHFAEERDRLLLELASLQKNIDHIKEIVAMQQAHATVVAVVEPLDAAVLMEDALQMNSASLSRHAVKLVREFHPAPLVLVEKGKVLQILVNLIRNAKFACDDLPQDDRLDKVIIVRVEPGAPGYVRLSVRDSGVGIPAENLTRIFGQGFTTRAYGHGFGLHSCALAAKQLKGSLTVHSDGPGQGATFTVELPVAEIAGPVGLPVRELAEPVGQALLT